MHALVLGSGTPFGDSGFGLWNVYVHYIYNPQLPHFSEKNYTLHKNLRHGKGFGIQVR